MIIQADVAAQTLGLAWLALGIVVLVALYASGRRPELAGMASTRPATNGAHEARRVSGAVQALTG